MKSGATAHAKKNKDGTYTLNGVKVTAQALNRLQMAENKNVTWLLKQTPEEIADRRFRFPSVQERVKVYMCM